MLKKIILGLVLTSSLFGENELWKFFKYSTAYGSFSLNAPRFQDDRFAIVGGLIQFIFVFNFFYNITILINDLKVLSSIKCIL